MLPPNGDRAATLFLTALGVVLGLLAAWIGFLGHQLESHMAMKGHPGVMEDVAQLRSAVEGLHQRANANRDAIAQLELRQFDNAKSVSRIDQGDKDVVRDLERRMEALEATCAKKTP